MMVGLYVATIPSGEVTIADVPNFTAVGVTFLFDDETMLIPYALSG
jgi:hypothetical protein